MKDEFNRNDAINAVVTVFHAGDFFVGEFLGGDFLWETFCEETIFSWVRGEEMHLF